MLETTLAILRIICSIVTISALLLKLLPFPKIVEKFSNFMQKHKVIAIIYIIMVAIGLFWNIFLLK